MSPQTENQKNGMVFKVLTIVFAVAIAALIFWSLSTKKQLNGLLVEKENLRLELKAELDQLMTQHNQLKAENETLSATLSEKDLLIQENAKQIEEGLKYKWSYLNVKKQLTALQEVAKGYEAKIEDLKLQNQNLINENTEVKGQLGAEQQKTSELTVIKNQLTEKVEIATIHKTYEVSALGIRSKTSGKEVVTDKSKRVDKIKICFTLAENALIKAGNSDIYIRIAQPDNAILTPDMGDAYAFDYNGEKLQYSIKTVVNYENQTTNVCCYWDKVGEQELAAGTYQADIYHRNSVIGQTSFILK